MADSDEVADLRRRVAALEDLIHRVIDRPGIGPNIVERAIDLAIEEQVRNSRPVGRSAGRGDASSTIYRQVRPKAGVELRSWLAVQTLGLSTEQVPLPRFFPIRLYADSFDEDNLKELIRALRAFLKAFGVEITDEFTPELGSYLQGFIGRFKKSMSSAEAQARLAKMERAVELQALGKAQAEIDRAQAESLAALIQACNQVDDASIQAGSIILEKRQTADGKVVIRSRTLTHNELIEIERRGRLVADGFGNSTGSIDDDVQGMLRLPQSGDGPDDGE